jgi:hypothetical protein
MSEAQCELEQSALAPIRSSFAGLTISPVTAIDTFSGFFATIGFIYTIYVASLFIAMINVVSRP